MHRDGAWPLPVCCVSGSALNVTRDSWTEPLMEHEKMAKNLLDGREWNEFSEVTDAS